jgi:hypothetical protein
VPEPIRGRDGLREFVNSCLTGFPDGTITVDDQIAEGEFVAWTGRGTNMGELIGMPPTGKQLTVEGITYSRMADGVAREARLIWDTLAMLQQLGAVPVAAPARTTFAVPSKPGSQSSSRSSPTSPPRAAERPPCREADRISQE